MFMKYTQKKKKAHFKRAHEARNVIYIVLIARVVAVI